MKLIILLLVAITLSLLTGGNALCQRLGQSDAPSIEQRLAEDLGGNWRDLPIGLPLNYQNLSDIVQKGNSNSSTTIQNNPGNVVNQAYILQAGSSNEAYLSQTGSGNTTRIQQQGDYNIAKSKVTGDDNLTNLTQDGFNNRIEREVTTNNAEFTLSQIGNDNSLIQIGAESLAPPKYQVEMRGNGIRLTVEQGVIQK